MKNEKLKDHFKRLTTFDAFEFQLEVADYLLNGKNVILQAPTGSGKTWASILPFVTAINGNLNFPQKMIYSLPMRTLANSLYKTVRENEFIKKNNLIVTLQTGEIKEDDYFFNGDIIFTTIDQSLSGLLSIPLSLPLRQANINAGAFIGSYLVFDEFHLLNAKTSLATLFYLLKILKGISPFCLMTATLSDSLLKRFANEVDVEIINVNKDEIKKIPSQANKQRIVEIIRGELTAEQIITKHRKDSRSIVICNRVDKCQQIFLDMEKLKNKGNENLKDTELLCIHSRFFGKDRKHKEEKIKEIFDKGSNTDAILVATQVIEVGLDITCNVMHTEISPINSLLQRFGRCARFANEQGKIYVYDVDKYLPYDERLSVETFEELAKLNKLNMNYEEGQKLIDNILTSKEISELEAINAGDRLEIIHSVWAKPDKSRANELIREIDSFQIIIANETSKVDDPYNYESVSMRRWSLLGKLKNIESDDWKIRAVREDNFITDDFDNELLSGEKYTLQNINVEDAGRENIIVVNSKFVSYSKEIGLNFFNIGNEISKERVKIKKEWLNLITKDTFEEHIKYLILAYNKYFKNKSNYLFKKLNKQLKINLSFDELIKFMMVLHDYGKLNVRWQGKAFEHQSKKEKLLQNILLAHTDYDSSIDKRVIFPPHAGIGALVSFPIALDSEILKTLDRRVSQIIIRAIATAIMKHHSPTATKVKKYNIHPQGIEATKVQLNKYAPGFSILNDKEPALKKYSDIDLAFNITKFSETGSNQLEIILYFVLVRVLRICDQKSFEVKDEISKEK